MGDTRRHPPVKLSLEKRVSRNIIVLKGRALDVVDDGIAEGWIAAVEAFDPALRDLPTDPAAPFIASIEFHPLQKEAGRAKPTAKPAPKHEPETAQRAKA